jgi:sugar (pentulose or hexulose) kinase
MTILSERVTPLDNSASTKAMNRCVAVFDVGKTNMKVVVFDGAGKVGAERGHPNGSVLPDAFWPYRRLYTAGAWAFLIGALKELGASFPIEAISISAHGAAGVLVDDRDAALPAVDYEFDIDPGIAAEYDKLRPPFEETKSPKLTRGLNLGKQVFYLQRRYPAEFAAVRAFLGYPQYWSWRLSGVAATEFTAMGAHTDLWRPYEGRPSSMVDKLGWRRLFPPMRKAWDTLGTLKPEVAAATGLSPDVRIVCGAHDSNASLVPHLISRRDPFTVISTGTWVIIMAVGGKAELDPKADMLANVDVRGEPVPTARFMGGREYAVLAGDAPADADEADIDRVIASGALALPAFSDQGGPFAARKGIIEGEAPTAPKPRAALATLYSALMTAHMLRRLEAPGELIVEGGFTRSPAFAAVLARLMPGRRVLIAPASAGAAAGAATLAHWGEPHPTPRLEPAPLWALPGLEAYQKRWERAL